jgi:hypothetical protein
MLSPKIQSTSSKTEKLGTGLKLRRVLTFCLLAGALLGVIAAASPLFISYDVVKWRLDAFSATHNAPFTPERWRRVMLFVRFMGAGLLTASLIGFLRLDALARLATAALADARVFFKALRDHCAIWFRTANRMEVVALIVIFVGGAALRLIRLNKPLNYDEAYSFIYYASKPLYIALSNYSSTNNHIFYVMLMHIFAGLFGAAEWVLRLPSFLASLAIMFVAFFLARVLYDGATALIATALIAGCGFFIDYGALARGYSVQLLFFLCSLGLSAFIILYQNIFALFLWAVVTALGFYTIPTYALPCGIVVIWTTLCILFSSRAEQRFDSLRDFALAVIGAALLTLLLYSPVLVASDMVRRFDFNIGVSERLTPFSLSGFVAVAKAWWADLNANTPRWLQYILAGALFAGFWAEWKTQRFKIPIYVATLLTCSSIILTTRSFFYPRVWIFLGIPVFFVAAVGISFVGRGVRLFPQCGSEAVSAAISLALFAVFAVNDVARLDSVRNMVSDGPAIFAALDKEMKPGDVVLRRYPFSAPFEYHLRRNREDYIVFTKQTGDDYVLELYGPGYGKDHPLRTNGRMFIAECPDVEKLDEIFPQRYLAKLRENGLREFSRFDSSVLYVVDRY